MPLRQITLATKHQLALLLLTLACWLLTGCTFNQVQPFSKGLQPNSDYAVLVYGLGVEGAWTAPRFAVTLDEYSLQTQAITGNCWHYNRTVASVPAPKKGIEYFAFKAPAGHYVYSAFNGATLDRASSAFHAPPGQITYIGDFILKENRSVTLVSDIAQSKAALMSALPDIKGEIRQAESTPVPSPAAFLCTP